MQDSLLYGCRLMSSTMPRSRGNHLHVRSPSFRLLSPVVRLSAMTILSPSSWYVALERENCQEPVPAASEPVEIRSLQYSRLRAISLLCRDPLVDVWCVVGYTSVLRSISHVIVRDISTQGAVPDARPEEHRTTLGKCLHDAQKLPQGPTSRSFAVSLGCIQSRHSSFSHGLRACRSLGRPECPAKQLLALGMVRRRPGSAHRTLVEVGTRYL